MVRSWSVLGLLSLLAACSQAATAADAAANAPPAATQTETVWAAADSPAVGDKIRQLMQDRKYSEAVQAIDEAAKAKDSPRDYLAYLKGWVLYLARQHEPAVAAFDQLNKEFPQSRWARRARFAKALSLARQGDFRGAETIYRGEVEFLLSPERRQDIAAIYLEFADAAFKGHVGESLRDSQPASERRDHEKPDFKKAMELYARALDVGPKAERREEIELRIAQCRQELNETAEAAKLCEKFSKDHPQSPLDIEARFRLGQCWMAQTQLKQARRVWQDLLAKYPDAKSERVAEAAFQLARTWRTPQPQTDEELSRGVAALDAFLERFPQHKLAGEAHLDVARSYLHRGRQEAAVAALTRFIKDERLKDRKELPEAWNLLGSAYQSQKKFAEALAAWREFLVKFPTHDAWSAVQKEIVTTEHLTAVESQNAKQYDAARKLYEEFLAKYPLDNRAHDIYLAFGQMNFDQKRWDAAIADWRRLTDKYPNTPQAAKARLMIAETLERLGKYEEAIEQYRKVPSKEQDVERRASGAVARLTAKTMTVATERPFRSDETPRLRLVTRNIESVTVRAYKVDLETYFRKMHQARNIEPLDISLIDPDRTFEFKVPGYARHAEIESRVEVPLPDGLHSGVMAVTVASKTLEATTLVLQSDLEIIVKSSRDEAFVFAENLRTGKPWPKARLLLSDGRQVFLETTTGPDGVFQKPLAELKNAADLRVFAAMDGHVASNAVDIRQIAVAGSLGDKGYIYTDRPVYRAGQQVHVRGCIRRAAGDAYVIDKDKKYTLDVLDARNRALHRGEAALGPFGTFHATFDLPAICPQGDYRLVVHDDAGRTFQGSFQVREFQPESIQLTIDSPRHIYYRGEEIAGTIRASYYYGAPLAGREIRFQLADEPEQVATTDAKGEVRFKLPTRELDEERTVLLTAEMPGQNVKTSLPIQIATLGFSIDVRTVRTAFIADEPFEVTVRTTDAEDKPIAEKLTLKVLELTFTGSGTEDDPFEDLGGERLVEEHPIATAADGVVRKSLKLAKGGHYRIRAEGTDRFKNPISAATDIDVCGEEDQMRLRILADRHTYKAGDTADVTVFWREAPALGLVTFQGTTILEYRLVELKTGANKLSIPMTARLAPNFELAVAVMTDRREVDGKSKIQNPESRIARRFHEAASPFAIEQDLRVALAWQRKGKPGEPVRPGDELEVTITTTDPQGKPVPAEVSLSMLPEAIFRLGEAPSVQAFFRDAARQTALATSSSITFEHRPATRGINSRLLAERDRQEVAASEEASRQRGLAERDFETDMSLRTKPRRSKLTAGGGMGGMGMAAAPSKSRRAGGEDVTVHERIVDMLQAAELRAQPGGGPNPLDEQPGYWTPSVVTGADGKAIVTLTVPQGPNQWVLTAQGITAETLAGAAEKRFVSRKPLFGQMKLPLAFTEGDQAEVAVTVHNDLLEKGPIEVALRTTLGGRSAEEKKTIEVKAKGIQEQSFKVPPLVQTDSAVFELTVSGGGASDVVRRVVPLLPHGMPVFAVSGGSATSDTAAWVEFPKDMALESPAMEIVVGPTVEQSLLDIVVAYDATRRHGIDCPASAAEQAASDVMAALALQKLVGASRDAAGPQAQQLDARIRLALGQLILAQEDDGGWAWSGGKSDRFMSARTVWAVSLARRAGYPVADDAFNKAIAYLKNQSAAADNRDFDAKAVLLHALTVAGQGEFSVANHLYRERASLSHAAIAYLALTFVEMDRKAMAAEVLGLLGKSDAATSRPEQAAAKERILPWSHSAVELRALRAMAAQAVAPKDAATKSLMDWLLAHRSGHRWSPDKATGPAAMALCQWFGENRFAGEHYKLAIVVNGTQVGVLDVDQAAVTRTVPVPATVLAAKDKQKVEFRLTGRGRYTYQCVLSGFVPAEKLKGTTSDWEVRRRYEPAPLEFAGHDVGRGFGLVQGRAAEFHNPLTQLPVARRGLVELTVARKNAAGGDEPLEYLVLTEPLPAGATVNERTIHGGFERYELSPGRITFYIGSPRTVDPITFGLDGYLPGKYRIGPTVVRDAYRPDQFAVSPPLSLAVLPQGATSVDPYRLSPDELFNLASRMIDKGDRKTALGHLTELVEKWNLKPEAYKRAVEMLLDIHLELGPAAKVVHYFEIVKERWPDTPIPLTKIVKVAAAYHDIGEFERSYLVFRATVEGSFTRESGIAGFLESEDEFLRSVEYMARLTRDYPPDAYVAEAEFALAQEVRAKAKEAAGDAKLREQKVNRVDLERRAWRMLESWLTAYPEDPAADQAAFAAANTLLDMKDFQAAANACGRYAARYPKSDLVDAFWYVHGYCLFALGQHKDAMEMFRKVAESQRIDKKTGRPADSPNKWRAIFLMGQIHHSLGQAADAIREYRRVEDKFWDAKRSIAWFTRKAIQLPEVTTVKPGTAAEVELSFRNIPACDAKVYRIDLMKFSLLAGDLSGITRINLAGIRPLHEAEVKLGDGLDYRDRTHKLPLPLDKEGAYLVVCRGENLHASGLVLVTPLAVEVQADRSGQVRAMVKDTAADRYLGNVEIRVIGSRMSEFISGTTDLRGVFVADRIQGLPTVIAQAGPGRYAFYRSPATLPEQPPDEQLLAGNAAPARRAASMNKPSPAAGEADPFGADATPAQPAAPKKPSASKDADPFGDEPSAAQPQQPTAKKPQPPPQPAVSAELLAKIEEASKSPVKLAGIVEDAATRRIMAALNGPTDIDFVDTPLTDVLSYLQDLHKINIAIDHKALEDAGIGTDTAVTRRLSGVSLRSALKLMLRDVGLTWTIDDEVLLITTPDEAQNRLVTIVYPAEDLLFPDGDTKRDPDSADYESLINLITSTVQPTSWDDVGGPGSITPFPNKHALVLSQTQEVHEEISDVLQTLRKLGGNKAVASEAAKAAAAETETTAAEPAQTVVAPRKERYRSMDLSRGAGSGMGGMGGGFGPPAARRAPGVVSVEPVDELLSGLQETSEELQKANVGKLKARYKKGGMPSSMGGGMGGMGMGGYGGFGVGAGSAY